ncbi:MAG TPA: hypothetical protein VEI03_08130 [Stellaceae bacterium]|nr:hypothetical protein [Stellaceae bacterium]
MKRALLLLAGLAPLWTASAGAAAPGADPDWPCQQVLVPVLSADMLWRGPPIEKAGDWQADPEVAALVRRIAPRDVTVEAGEAAIGAFAATLGADKARRLTLVFAGLLDETNRDRSEVIERLKDLARRQRNLAALIDRLTTELDAAPAEPGGEASASQTELQQRWSFTSRSYAEMQRTMRYACEVPRTLDARLGAYAHVLEAALP